MENILSSESAEFNPIDVPLIFSGDTDSPTPSGDNNPQVSASSNRPTEDPFTAAVGDATKSFQQTQATDLISSSTYDPEIKERYKGDPSIYNDYFDPYSDNESVAYRNWDTWDAIGSALGGFKDNFAAAYSESAYTWVRAGKALFNMDVDYLSPTIENLDEMSYAQRRAQIENPIFYAPGEEDDILSKGFLAEAISNLGFTFGTISEVITEQVITKAIEAGLTATGVGAGAAAGLEAAADVQAATKLGRMWKQLSSLFTAKALGKSETLINAAKSEADDLSIDYLTQFSGDVTSMAHSLNAMNNVVTNGVRYSKGFLDNALSVGSKVPFVGEVADAARIARAGKGILNSEEIIRLGAGGLRRSFAEWQMAAGEAAIEAGGNYKELMDKMTDDFRAENNRGPSAEELQGMKQIALKSSTIDFGTNAAILGVMNKLTFGNLLGKFATDSKKVAAIKDFITSNAAKKGVYTVMDKAANKAVNYQLGTLGVLGILPKISSDFTKKQALWEFGKSTLKGVTRIEVAEGIQENLQEGTNEGLVDYYYSIYKNDVADWGQSFNEALASQTTKQGAKTFLMGALTGIFSRPGMMAIEKIQESKYLNPSYAAHKESVAESLEFLNKFYDPKNMENTMKEAVKQIKLQGTFSEAMVSSISLNDKLQYYNNHDSAVIKAIMHAKRTGTLDTLTAMLGGYGTNFNEAQFKEAFGYTPKELGKSSVSDVMSSVADSAQKYSDIYDKYSTKFSLLLSAGDLIKDPNARAKFEVRKAALLDAISTVAFIGSKSQAVLDRAANIVQRLAKHESIGQSLATSFQTLTNNDKLSNSIFLLEQEIRTLESAQTAGTPVDPATKELINSKSEELALLQEIQETMFQALPQINPETGGVEMSYVPDAFSLGRGRLGYLSQIMSRYFTIKNAQNGNSTVVTKTDVDGAIQDIYDYMILGRDHQEYSDAVNMLNDPETFGKYHERIMDARVAAHARLFYDDIQKLAEISEVAKKWVQDNQDILDKLLKFSKMPSGTYANLAELERIRKLILEKTKEFRTGAAAATAKPAESAGSMTDEERAAIIEKNKQVKPAADLHDNPATRDEANEYMASRYDLEEIEKNFSFTSTDPKLRSVKRYYFNEKGERVPYGTVTVASEWNFGLGNVPVDNMESLLEYLRLIEQGIWENQQAAKAEAQASEALSAEVTQQLDLEKTALANYIDQPVIFNGMLATLRKSGDLYIVEFEDGSKTVLGKDEVDKPLTLNDIVELSLAYSEFTPVEKEAVGHTESTIIDVNQEGVVTIEIDETLDHAWINGIKWTFVKNEDGLVTEFTSVIEKKKGKGVKRVLLRLGPNNPKTIEYAARINRILLLSKEPISDNIDELLDEIEVLNNAESIIDQLIAEETDPAKRSDLIVAEYQVNKILSLDNNPRILELKSKFDSGTQLSEDELLELAVWAEETYDRIKKTFSLYITNPVLNSHLQILQKQYINPISDKLFKKDVPRKPRSKKSTTASTSKKKRGEQQAKAAERRKRKPSAAEPKEGAKPKKDRKKNIVDTVNQLELDFTEKATKKRKTKVNKSASSKQMLPVVDSKKIINKMTKKEVKGISDAIDTAQEKPDDSNPFASLTSKKTCEI